MERKEKIIRFLSQAAEEKKVEEEGIGLLSPDGYHGLVSASAVHRAGLPHLQRIFHLHL